CAGWHIWRCHRHRGTEMAVPRTRHVAGAEGPAQGEYDADVIILALDRPGETRAAILSALEETGVRRHVTSVDQGACHGALARLAEPVRGRTDATLIALDRNLGVPAGRNIASSVGHGRIIVGLDNDAAFDDRATVARMVAAFDAHPDLGAIGCRIVVDATG